MAQPKFDQITIKLSKKIGDEVSTAAADGTGGITAAMRLGFINDGRNKLYLGRLVKLGIDGFIDLFPEFVTSEILFVVSSSVPLDNFIKKVLSAKLFVDNTGISHLLHEIPPDLYQDAEINEFSTNKPNDGFKVFSVFDNRINILPNVLSEDDNVTALCLNQPIAIVQGGSNPDIFEPENWIPDIVEAAYQEYLTTIQKAGN